MTRMSRSALIRTVVTTALSVATVATLIAAESTQAVAVPVPTQVVATAHGPQESSASQSARRGRTAPACSNPLGATLHAAGFRGRNLREAWAIAMRESSGRASLGPGTWDFNGHDWGLFQWNKPSFGNQPWWNDSKMLNGVYNARMAFRFSRGGRDWHLWGLTGSGRTSAALYADYGWSPSEIYAWITEPFQRYFRQFPASARGCG